MNDILIDALRKACEACPECIECKTCKIQKAVSYVEKYEWHDLRKDKKDLPVIPKGGNGVCVLIAYYHETIEYLGDDEPKSEKIVCEAIYSKCGFWSPYISLDYYCSGGIMSGDVIMDNVAAWKYLDDTFEDYEP